MPINLVIALNPVVVFAYVIWQGLDRFFVESYGTLLLSPLIYIRLLPAPFSEQLLRAANASEWLNWLILAIPLGMLLAALLLSVRAFFVRSLLSALVATLLVTLVFGVYHSVKHMGLTVVYY